MAVSNRILDTNVLVNANGDQSPQTTAACKQACLKLLMSAMANDYQLVVDGGKDPDSSEILAEYRRNLHVAGGGFGEIFLRWVLQHWQQLILVPITPAGESYAEFPDDQRLKGFDRSDHKWIATAVSCGTFNDEYPEIVQSADDKWRAYAPIFAEYRVVIDFLCDERA